MPVFPRFLHDIVVPYYCRPILLHGDVLFVGVLLMDDLIRIQYSTNQGVHDCEPIDLQKPFFFFWSIRLKELTRDFNQPDPMHKKPILTSLRVFGIETNTRHSFTA